MTKQPTYLEALRERVLIYDGAMGTSIDTFHLTPADYGGERRVGGRGCLGIHRPVVVGRECKSFM